MRVGHLGCWLIFTRSYLCSLRWLYSTGWTWRWWWWGKSENNQVSRTALWNLKFKFAEKRSVKWDIHVPGIPFVPHCWVSHHDQQGLGSSHSHVKSLDVTRACQWNNRLVCTPCWVHVFVTYTFSFLTKSEVNFLLGQVWCWLLQTVDTKITLFSVPWNFSTVPTLSGHTHTHTHLS